MKRRAERGFSLLETVAALAVLAVALAACLRVAGESARNTAHLRDRTLAHWVALNQATERRVRREWPEAGLQKGMERMADREWHWSVLVSTTEDARVRRLDIQVRTTTGESAPVLARLEAFLPKPPEGR
ncbi:MAG: type II secretion system minor pseudopilin GspI [Magnetococcales bacterium]|nr:type II secretion system minor pseudopilin GspI [Magnetococcales bacterium]